MIPLAAYFRTVQGLSESASAASLMPMANETGLVPLIEPHQSKKSSVPGSKDGKYVGGKGSSHKGGHYTNAKTGNHERNRKGGIPK